jgi:hypothetical protein
MFYGISNLLQINLFQNFGKNMLAAKLFRRGQKTNEKSSRAELDHFPFPDLVCNLSIQQLNTYMQIEQKKL